MGSFVDSFTQRQQARLSKRDEIDEQIHRVQESIRQEQLYREEQAKRESLRQEALARENAKNAFEYGTSVLQDPTRVMDMEEKGTLQPFVDETTKHAATLGIKFTPANIVPAYVRGLVQQAKQAMPNGTPTQWLGEIRNILGSTRYDKYKPLIIDSAAVDQMDAKQKADFDAFQKGTRVTTPEQERSAIEAQNRNAAAAQANIDLGQGPIAPGQQVVPQTGEVTPAWAQSAQTGLGFMEQPQDTPKPTSTPQAAQPFVKTPDTPAYRLPATPTPRLKSRDELEAAYLYPDWQPSKELTAMSTFNLNAAKNPDTAVSTAVYAAQNGMDWGADWLGQTAAKLNVYREPGETDDSYYGKLDEAYVRHRLDQSAQAIKNAEKEGERKYTVLLSTIAANGTSAARINGMAAMGITKESDPLTYQQYMNMTPEAAQVALKQRAGIMNAETRKDLGQQNLDWKKYYQGQMLKIGWTNADTAKYNAALSDARLKLSTAVWTAKMARDARIDHSRLQARLTGLTTAKQIGFVGADGKPLDDDKRNQAIAAMDREIADITETMSGLEDRMQGQGEGAGGGNFKPLIPYPGAPDAGSNRPAAVTIIPGSGGLKTAFSKPLQDRFEKGIRQSIANGEKETLEQFLAKAPEKYKGKDGKGTELTKIWKYVHGKR